MIVYFAFLLQEELVDIDNVTSGTSVPMEIEDMSDRWLEEKAEDPGCGTKCVLQHTYSFVINILRIIKVKILPINRILCISDENFKS